MQDNIPSVVQVIPYEDYTVDVYFDDGKIVCYNAGRDMSPALFARIRDPEIFLGRCTVLNGTLAWDVAGGRDESACIEETVFSIHLIEKLDLLLTIKTGML